MGFPTVERYGGDFGSSNLAVLTVPISTVSWVAGDIAILVLGIDHGAAGRTGVWSDGATELIDGAGIAEAGLHIAAKILTSGDITRGSFTFTLDSGSERGGWAVWRVQPATMKTGTLADIQLGSRTTGVSTAPNPASFSPTGGAADRLAIALMCSDTGNLTVTGYPSGYTDGEYLSGGTVGGATLATARRQITAATEDAGAFTTSASEEWDSLLLTIDGTAGGATQNITSAGAIATAEAFGTVTAARGAVAVSPGSVGSSEAFGASAVLPGAVSLAPGGIASGESFGTAALAVVTALQSVGAISSAEAFGSATLSTGPVNVVATGIASAEAFGSAAVVPPPTALSPAGIATAEALGSPALRYMVAPASIATAEAFGSVLIEVGATTILPSAIGTAETFGATTIRLDVTLYPEGWVDSHGFGSPSVTAARWKVYVDDIDRTTFFRPLKQFRIEMGAAEQIGVLDAMVFVPEGTWEPQVEDPIRVEDASVEVYEGFIKQRAVSPLPGTSDVFYKIAAQDLTNLLTKDYIVTGVRSVSETAKQRIEWLLTTFGTKGIVGGATVVAPQSMPSGEDGIPRQDFNGYTLAEAIEAVLRAVGRGHRYYVDRDYKLHVFEDVEASVDAPFGFSETPDGNLTEPIIGLEMTEDSIDLAHKILVVGGSDRQIRRERDLTDIGGVMPAAGDELGYVHYDSSITSDAQADAFGDNYLRLNGHVHRSGSMTTYRPGLKSGQNSTIDHPAAGLVDFPIRINQVDIELVSDTLVRYTVHWGDRLPALTDWRRAHYSSEVIPQDLLPGSVDTSHLADGAVTSDKIVDLAIASTHIQDSAILTPKLAANAVTANEIAANAVTAVKVAANAITTVKLNADAVTTDKIAAGAVTATEIAANSIDASHIQANSIDTSELKADAVTTDKIAAGAITATEIASGAITTAKLAADAVTADKIDAGTITATEIASGAITAAKIASGAITTDKLLAGSVAIKNGSGEIILDPSANEALQVWGAWNVNFGASTGASTFTSRTNIPTWPFSYPPFIVGMVNLGGGKSVLMPYTQYNISNGLFETFFYAYSTDSFIECVRVTRVAAPAMSMRILALTQGSVNG